jgi:hypothetical protein
MGWRDALKSFTSGGGAAGEPQDITAIASDEPEPDWFVPRTDGTYVGGAPDGRFRYLRFGLNGKVHLAAGPATAAEARPLLGPDNPDPVVGLYTPAGRFTTQQRFERPVVFTVLAISDPECRGFTARVTTTGPAHTGEYGYLLQPDD